MKKLIILRGVPGSGKSTFGRFLEESIPGHVHFENDDYFFDDDGNYNFSFSSIQKAVEDCLKNVKDSMEKGISSISVGNTFTKHMYVDIYLDMAKEYGYQVTSLVVENRHSGVDTKGVPEKTLVDMEKSLRDSIKLR